MHLYTTLEPTQLRGCVHYRQKRKERHVRVMTTTKQKRDLVKRQSSEYRNRYSMNNGRNVSCSFVGFYVIVGFSRRRERSMQCALNLQRTTLLESNHVQGGPKNMF